MTKILVLGAGRSSGSLIQYLLDQSSRYDWKITIADEDVNAALSKVNMHPNGNTIQLSANDVEQRQQAIQQHDMVVSLLPAFMHIEVAKDCLKFKKNLATASYISKEMRQLEKEVEAAGLCFVNEIGLDPGLDHISAMQTIHSIEEEGGKITAFYSHTGGLVAPESDNNPWHYKISWNPRNVVLAGQGTAQYLENGKVKFIPYQRLFKQHLTINVEDYGNYEVYANRDSLQYIDIYGLHDVKTILRGTIRGEGFCGAWDALRELGYTDSTSLTMPLGSTFADLTRALCAKNYENLSECLAQQLDIPMDGVVMSKLKWLGILDAIPLSKTFASPAEHLEQLLLQKWVLQPEDHDMVIMQHTFHFENALHKKIRTSTMVVKGEDKVHTAMAKLVGLPLGICVKLLLTGVIQDKGVIIPLKKEQYEPILRELTQYGIFFRETEQLLDA